jgi:protein SCO1/2
MSKAKPSTYLVYGVIFVAFFVTAHYLSKQINKPSSLPYYLFDASTNKLEKSALPGQQIGNFAFSDQKGQPYSQEDLGPVVFVADYFFVECPGICKVMSSELERVYDTFESDSRVKILSFTSKPEEDSTIDLLHYAERHGVRDHSKWVFLRGDKKELYKVARSQFVIVDEPGDGGEDDFIHTERFALIDQKKYVRGYYDGTNPKEVDRLILDIKALLEE